MGRPGSPGQLSDIEQRQQGLVNKVGVTGIEFFKGRKNNREMGIDLGKKIREGGLAEKQEGGKQGGQTVKVSFLD